MSVPDRRARSTICAARSRSAASASFSDSPLSGCIRQQHVFVAANKDRYLGSVP